MRSFIVDFKLDSHLNSVSQNSPFFTPRCKIQVWATIGQGERPLITIVLSLTQRPLLHQLWIFKGSSPPPPTGLPAFEIPSSVPNKLWRAAHCIGSRHKELLLSAATQGPANLMIWGTPSGLAPSCYPCKGKERPTRSNNNFVQPWSPNLLLQPPAPSLQWLIAWTGLSLRTSTGL